MLRWYLGGFLDYLAEGLYWLVSLCRVDLSHVLISHAESDIRTLHCLKCHNKGIELVPPVVDFGRLVVAQAWRPKGIARSLVAVRMAAVKLWEVDSTRAKSCVCTASAANTAGPAHDGQTTRPAQLAQHAQSAPHRQHSTASTAST